MSGFGWSAGDVVLAAKFIAKVVQALKETGGARDEYRRAIEFLSGLEQTLQNLASAGRVLPRNAATQEILLQTKRIVDVLGPLHGQLKESEPSLGTAASGDAAARLKSKLKWTFQQSKKVERLEDTISVPLATINANIGMQILSLIAELRSDLPAATCDALSTRINNTILCGLRTELQPVSQAIERQTTSSAMVLDSIQTHLAAQVDSQRAVEANLADKVDEVQTELELLRISVETNAAALDHTVVPVPTSTGGSPLSQTELDPRDRMIQSLCAMAHSIRELLIAMLELAWPFLLLFLRKLEAMRQHLSRQIMGDSIIFEDALGRLRYLPYEFFQHWDVFHPYLMKTFEKVPGAYYLAQGRYHLLNSNTGAIVDPRVWRTAVKAGSRISMSIVTVSLSSATRACPCCGGVKKWTGSYNFATCSTCSAAYRLFESRRRKHLQPQDGSPWLKTLLGGQKSGIQANEFSQQLFTTPFSSPRAQSKITEFDEIDVEDLHQEDFDLKRFKKIDIISINEPGKVADSVEEMMNLVLRFKDSEEILPAERCAAIVETIALVRAEAQQGVTIFDFESEDNLFLTHSKNLVQSLSAVISTPYLSDIDLRDLSSRIETWRKWISCRIVRTLHQDILSGQVQDSGMLLVLNTLTGKRRMIRVQQTTTIQEIKYMFQDLEGLPPWDQYLVSRGKKLEEDRRVLDYHLHTQAYVHVLLPIWGRR